MKQLIILFLITLSLSCANSQDRMIEVRVENLLNFDRSYETVEIELNNLAFLETDHYAVIDKQTNDTLISQVIKYNDADNPDVLLFQPLVPALSTKQYNIVRAIYKEKDSAMLRCYSRFVPERTDDYAWENDKVAFRTYGPTAQRMVEDGVRGGTLSSGIDAWLKRVNYPIINKWYKKYTSGKGTYHKDTGEGLDNFHVGASRGIGGIAIKNDTTYQTSKNFTNWKTFANGPIRTSFSLDYASWNANGQNIKETKYISLDYGQNLSKIKIEIRGADTISVGLTLHKQDGVATTNSQENWMSYWEPLDDSELGQGVVIPSHTLAGYDKYITAVVDKSNLYAHLKVEKNKVIYYAGFGWKKSGQFNTKKDWDTYLSTFSECIQTPLKIMISSKN